MRLVIDHVTHMSGDHICVAGYDTATHRWVRPLLPNRRRLTTAHLASNGGCFDLGCVIELGRVTPAPPPKEIEDHHFERFGELSLHRRGVSGDAAQPVARRDNGKPLALPDRSLPGRHSRFGIERGPSPECEHRHRALSDAARREVGRR